MPILKWNTLNKHKMKSNTQNFKPTTDLGNDANRLLAAVSIDEAAEIIQTLMAYGNIRPIEGVVYPEGTHKEMLRKADEWLWCYRSERNGR